MQQPSKGAIYKKELKIGFLTENLTVEYFKFLYPPILAIEKHIISMRCDYDRNSLLHEKYLQIELTQPYYFTKAYLELKN